MRQEDFLPIYADSPAKDTLLQDIINAIPGGIAIYRVSDIFETVYFSDGVPELTGYTIEEYRELVKRDAAEMTFREDTEMVIARAKEVIEKHNMEAFEFRKLHKDGHIVWVRAQIKWIGEENGCPLIQCVFHNISDLKEAQLEMEHLLHSIPGGIASYRIEGEKIIPVFYSDGIMALSGHTREEFFALYGDDALGMVYTLDRERVVTAAKAALLSGEVLDVSFRMRHRDGKLIWVHLNGRRIDPVSDNARFYAVFTGMGAAAKLFQNMADESVDGIYVVSRENHELLYSNEAKVLFLNGKNVLGQKCYAALHGKSEPCDYCILNTNCAEMKEQEVFIPYLQRFYGIRYQKMDWSGIPAYVQYIRDITDEVKIRKEKERLEQYFQTIVKNLAGGIAVVRYESNGALKPEYLSDGFAAMCDMALEEVWDMYEQDAMAGVHPQDKAYVLEQVDRYVLSGENQCECVYRLERGDGGYLWVKANLTLIQNDGGERRFYAMYHDITREKEEQTRLRDQYEEMIVQHYGTPGPNALLVGHCNITQGRILNIKDYTDSHLAERLGMEREGFFCGLAEFVSDEEERRIFKETYLKEPVLKAFLEGEKERRMTCFIRFPEEAVGRYARIRMSMLSNPDSGDIMGILNVEDITEAIISEKVLNRLSVTGFDFVVDINLYKDSYKILSHREDVDFMPKTQGCHSKWMEHMLETRIVPKDREQYRKCLEPECIMERLKKGTYTFAFSIIDDGGDIRTKNMTVSAIDLRLGRVCLARTDITDSVREQQGLLNMVAYTFDLACFIHVDSGKASMYTRQMIQENLTPVIVDNYNLSVKEFTESYGVEEGKEIRDKFCLEIMQQSLREKPSGYDFVFTRPSEEGLRYKQVSVLWGDENHKTICMVRADVTDMLLKERQTKQKLENALMLAEKASRAKSDFLSAMSHDIRTPMNAIMGMTALAIAHLDDHARVADYLQKISISSKHLLSLINDILDMSKIEGEKVSLNHMKLSISGMCRQLSDMLLPQAEEKGLHFEIREGNIARNGFYGDVLRINQIMINLLSNAIKFTPEGGRVDFLVEEIPAHAPNAYVRYRFTIRDTGIGMTEDFRHHIYEPFARSENAADIEGTGLGLSITKGLVDLMKGTITMESCLGKGSVFRVELEFEAASGGDTALEEQDAAFCLPCEGNKKLFSERCFLIAEDNAINAEILCGILDMFGAKTVVKHDGKEALEAFIEAAGGTYDAVLMDIQMPVMNGYETTRAIRKLEHTDALSVPIIAMTANAYAEDVRASLEAGMSAHISKPIDVEVLRTTLCRELHMEEE